VTEWTEAEDAQFRAAADGAASRNGSGPEPDFHLEVLTARQMCELPLPPTEDNLLGPLVVRGQRCVIGAHTGHGKTSIVLQAIAAITEQREFLGWRGAGGKALIIDCEQGLRTVQRRLREAGLDTSDLVDYIRVPDGLELNRNPAHIAEVERHLASGNYVVVFIDPLYKLHTGDSNDEREATELMRCLDAWRELYQFALLLAVHLRKPPQGTRFTIHEFFGSSAYVRGPEIVVGLQRLSDGAARLHFFKDRPGDLPAIGTYWALLFDREQGFRRDPTDGEHKPTARDEVERHLRDNPGMTQAELMRATDYKERTIRDALRQLGAANDGRKPAHWRLTEPDEGLFADE
jgi:AAA domain